ncbi:hypothetical protein AB835_06435, partial [Candidatus Endobugula sertula]
MSTTPWGFVLALPYSLLSAVCFFLWSFQTYAESMDEPWQYCADEWNICHVPVPAKVRYGIEGHYVIQEVDRRVECRNRVFGNPANARKHCDYLLSDSTDYDQDGVVDREDAFPADGTESRDTDGDGLGDHQDPFVNDSTNGADQPWQYCAGEFFTCVPPVPTLVRYGIDVQYVYRHATGAIACRNHAFGNPANARKHCDYLLSDSTDYDQDGVMDREDAFPADATESQDTDSDGLGDNNDPFPLDATNSADSNWQFCALEWFSCDISLPALVRYGVNGQYAYINHVTGPIRCSNATFGNPNPYAYKACYYLVNDQIDSDSDGVVNINDAFPFDPTETHDVDNDGIGDNADTDRDGDGIDNVSDAFPNDANESSDLDGDGIGDNADTDRDGDNVNNDQDAFPNDPNESSDLDNDGIGDNADTDHDGDGVDNTVDAFPNDANETRDTDGDGVGDNGDNDRDGDGVPNAQDAFPDDSTESSDLDNDGIGDNSDPDRDGDGVANDTDFFPDDPEASTVPTVTIDSPNTLTTVGSSPATITGTLNDDHAALTVNGVAISHNGGTFTANVALEEGLNDIVVRAIDQRNHQGIATIVVSLDKTPPTITLESPLADSTVYQDTINVTGLVNDIVRGTISEDEAQVTVVSEINTVTASIANRAYLAEGVELHVGDNTLTITAVDAVGNMTNDTFTIHYQEPQGKILSIQSGQGQRADIQHTLPDPLTVFISENGNPVANHEVVFRVIQGDGQLRLAADDEDGALAHIATTNNNGFASVYYQLGSRAGNGNHQVRATTMGSDGEVIFLASAHSGAGQFISVIDGNNQRGVVRQPLAKPFVVAVTDDGVNFSPNVPVTFTVEEGSGRFSHGEATITVQTDNDGRASAPFTLGPEQGIDAQRVIVTIPNSNNQAGFTASGLMPGDPGQTRLSGVVLDNQDRPVPGVTLRIEGSTRQAISDAQGQFTISEAPAGPVHLLVDGSTATRAGEWSDLSFSLFTVPGVDNPMAAPIYLVDIDTDSAVLVGAEDATVSLRDIPDYSLLVKAGSATFPDGSKTGQVSITRVNANKVPMVPPNGLQPQLVVTIQPHDVKFDPPAPLTTPNTEGYAPLSEIEMYSFDHDLEEFVAIGLGVVSKDGRTITSKPGSGVIKAGWHLAATNPSETGNVGNQSDNPKEADPVEPENGCESQGCPVWSVNKKTLNIQVMDTPLWYDSPIGPDVLIKLTYNTKAIAHNNRRASDPVVKALIENSELFGNRWNFAYNSGVYQPTANSNQFTVWYPSGQTETFINNSGTYTAERADVYDVLELVSTDHFRLTKLNGEVMDYQQPVNGNRWLMTRYTDIHQESLSFTYHADGTMATLTDAIDRTTTFAYTTVGTKKVDDGNGGTTTVDIRRVNQITDPFGRTALFAYDTALNLTEITDMGNFKSTLSYDSTLNIASITRPQFGTWQFKVEESGGADYGNDTYPAPDARMGNNERVTITDPNGHKTEYYFDAFNDRTWVVKPKFYKEYVNSEQSNKNQPKTIYQFKRSTQGWRRITRITDEEGNVDRKTFHSNGQLRSEQYQNGRSDFYEYNDEDQMTAKILVKGSEVVRRYEYEYLNDNTLLVSQQTGPSVASGKRVQTLTGYDVQQNITSITRHGFNQDGTPVSRQHTLSYNSRSQMTQVDGSRTDVNDISTFAYYDCADTGNPNCGQLQTLTNALGHKVRFTQYTASGLVSQMIDDNGLVTDTQYDGLQRVIQIEQYDQAAPTHKRTTRIHYRGAKKHIASASYANGLVVNYVYDDKQRVTEVKDNLGNRMTYRYDEDDQPIVEQTFGTTNNQRGGTEQLQNTVEHTYNQLDVITQINHAGSMTQFNPDGYGNIDSSIDPNANPQTEYTYDPLYRMTRLQDAIGNTFQYEYNVKDQLIKVRTDNNAVTTYQYNDFGDRLQEDSPDRGMIHYQYDNASNVTQLTDGRGVTSHYVYDALNRVTAIIYSDTTENITYVYDNCINGIGRVCQVTDPSGTTRFEYNVYGNIIQQTKVELGQSDVTSYRYDDVDQISSMTYPNGIQLTYQRDERSRITDITLNHSSLSHPQTILSGITYRADHQMSQCTLGNGVTETRQYDLQGRLTRQQLSDNLLTRDYSYDANGNILHIDSNTFDPAYTYDALNRLLSEDTPSMDGGSAGNARSRYQYDENSNRLTQLFNGEALAYEYQLNSNRLTTVGDSTITLDDSGNTVTDGNRAFQYNNRNQLKTFSNNDTQVASYEYDYRNLRTQKSLNGSDSNIYRYDLNGRRIQHNKNNQNHTSTIYLGWQPVAHIQHKTNGDIDSITYLTGDQLGSPRLGTDQNKTVVWNWEADAFGSTEPNQDPDGDTFLINIENRFAGQYHDRESGLHYNWHRYYDPATG